MMHCDSALTILHLCSCNGHLPECDTAVIGWDEMVGEEVESCAFKRS